MSAISRPDVVALFTDTCPHVLNQIRKNQCVTCVGELVDAAEPERTKVERVQVADFQVRAACEEVRLATNGRLDKKGRGAFHARHEALGVITEEYIEVVEAVHAKDRLALRGEFIDLAVASAFAVASLDAQREGWGR